MSARTCSHEIRRSLPLDPQIGITRDDSPALLGRASSDGVVIAKQSERAFRVAHQLSCCPPSPPLGLSVVGLRSPGARATFAFCVLLVVSVLRWAAAGSAVLGLSAAPGPGPRAPAPARTPPPSPSAAARSCCCPLPPAPWRMGLCLVRPGRGAARRRWCWCWWPCRLDGPDLAGQSEQVGGVDRRRLDRLDRGHSELDHQLELVGVAAVLGHAGVGAEGDLHARRIGLLQRLAGDPDAPVDLLLHRGRYRRWGPCASRSR